MDYLNVNLGLLGHVDSGKTSLARALSQIGSTAAFDKAPQSQERGITIDLGFSSWRGPLPDHLKNKCNVSQLQLTFVDCPGHASLIRTVLGGILIIDLIILVIDSVKGVQTQTAECMLLAEITGKPVIIVLNKTDLLSHEKLVKLDKKMRATISNMSFSQCPIVKTSALNNDINSLLECILSQVQPVERDVISPLLIAVDHCFAIQGKGTILTGTVLRGSVKINDEIEILTVRLVRKVKSIQVFRVPVNQARPGDRIGLCVSQVDPADIERGLICAPGTVISTQNIIISFNRVRFYTNAISSKSSYHITIGYENVFAPILLLEDLQKDDFTWGQVYRYLPENEKTDDKTIFALIQLDHPVHLSRDSLVIGAKLDVDVHTSSCRLAFFGRVVHVIDKSQSLSELKIYKEKTRQGLVDRVVDNNTIIGRNMFQKNSDISKFINLKVSLSTGETGRIESSFGQSGKFKVRFDEELSVETQAEIAKKSAEVVLHHKRFIFDVSKKILQ